MGFQQFLQNETIAIELVQEGKDLIAREKRRRQRAEEAMMRRRDFNTNNDFMSKYRNLSTQPPALSPQSISSVRSPNDGLLRDGENLDYATVRNTSGSVLGMTRSLSDEINERFGVSTQVQIGFRGTTPMTTGGGDPLSLNDDLPPTRLSSPPRNLFDDV